jgi:hypothetical protein
MKTFEENQDTEDIRMSKFSETISIIFVTVIITGSVIAILFF